MKIFTTVRKQYAILGICPSNQSNQSTQNYSLDTKIFCGFLLIGCFIGSQFMYIFYVADSFMDYMQCICTLSGTWIVFVCFLTIALKKHTLFESIDDIEKLIDSRFKHPESKKFFLKSSGQVERSSEIVFTIVVKVTVQLLILPKSIVSFGVYLITDAGSDSFQLPLPIWFPFDWDNPIGYLIAVALEYIVYGYEFFLIACTLALGIGAYWFAISGATEIQRILHAINDKSRTKVNQANELNVLFLEYIRVHGIMKQVERNFSDIFQPIFVSLFTWSLLAISGAMLIIQVEILHHGHDIPLLIIGTVNGIFGFIFVFIACELGQGMTEAFNKINLTIEQFNWYLLPIEMKRMLPMVIVMAQQPVSLECFGSITCCRLVYKQIIQRAFSYFMVLRQIGLF